jgi:hypothetical protein
MDKHVKELLTNIWYDNHSAVIWSRINGSDVAILDIAFGLGTAYTFLKEREGDDITPYDAEDTINELGQFVLDAIKEKMNKQQNKP